MEKDFTGINIFENNTYSEISSNRLHDVNESNTKDKIRNRTADTEYNSAEELNISHEHRIDCLSLPVTESSKRSRCASSSSDEGHSVYPKECPPSAAKLPKISDRCDKVTYGNNRQRLKNIEVNSNSTLKIVRNILVALMDLKSHVMPKTIDHIVPHNNECLRKIKSCLPLETKEAVTAFQQLLTDDQFYSEFVRILHQVGGSSAKDFTERILTKVFSPMYAMNNTWEGKVNKYSVKNFMLTAIMEEVVLKKYPDWDSAEFGKTGINWFRLGNQRAGSQPGQLRKKYSGNTINNEFLKTSTKPDRAHSSTVVSATPSNEVNKTTHLETDRFSSLKRISDKAKTSHGFGNEEGIDYNLSAEWSISAIKSEEGSDTEVNDESRMENVTSDKHTTVVSNKPTEYDDSGAVDDNCPRLKVIEANLHSTLMTVGEIMVELRKLKQHILAKSNDLVENPKQVKCFLPLDTKEAVTDFEQLLTDDQFYNEFVRILHQVGGSSAKDFTERILTKVFSPMFAMNNTWEGKVNKYSVKNLTVTAIIEGVVLKKYPDWTSVEFGKAGINWFRLGNQRARSQLGQLRKRCSGNIVNNEFVKPSVLTDKGATVENAVRTRQVNNIPHRDMGPVSSPRFPDNNKAHDNAISDSEIDLTLTDDSDKNNDTVKSERDSDIEFSDQNGIGHVTMCDKQTTIVSNQSMELGDSEEVDDNSPRLKIIEGNLNTTLNIVGKILVELRELKKHVMPKTNDHNELDNNNYEKQIKALLPLETKEAVTEFEQLLTEDQFYREFVRIVHQVGGFNAKDFTERILSTIFSPLFAKENTWEGKINKYSVKNLTVTSIIEDIVLNKYPSWNSAEFGKTGINWFRLGNQRAGYQPGQLRKKIAARISHN